MTVKVNYTYDPTAAPAAANGPVDVGVAAQQQLRQFAINIADVGFKLEPRAPEPNTSPALAVAATVPCKFLRVPNIKAVIASGALVVDETTAKPHLDYALCKDSTELVYITKAIVGTGLVKKIMSAGAKAGDTGRMELYQGATAKTADVSGDFDTLLVREFVINAADIAGRDSAGNQPQSGSAPTVDAATKNIVDNGGDGWHHI